MFVSDFHNKQPPHMLHTNTCPLTYDQHLTDAVTECPSPYTPSPCTHHHIPTTIYPISSPRRLTLQWPEDSAAIRNVVLCYIIARRCTEGRGDVNFNYAMNNAKMDMGWMWGVRSLVRLGATVVQCS